MLPLKKKQIKNTCILVEHLELKPPLDPWGGFDLVCGQCSWHKNIFVVFHQTHHTLFCRSLEFPVVFLIGSQQNIFNALYKYNTVADGDPVKAETESVYSSYAGGPEGGLSVSLNKLPSPMPCQLSLGEGEWQQPGLIVSSTSAHLGCLNPSVFKDS